MAEIDVTNPRAIAKILPILDLAHAVCMDLLRGGSVAQRDSQLLRDGLIEVRDLVRALNESRPWDGVVPSSGALDGTLGDLTCSASGGVV